MSFWDLSDGAQAQQQTSFVAMEEIKPIPSGTVCKAIISEAKWTSYMGEEYIDLTWKVIDGTYKNRNIFHKVRVNSEDAKKADKAKKMLAAIATNAGGELFIVQGIPSDADLARCLTMKPMAIKLQVWSMNDDATGETKTGNWVSAVSESQAADLAAQSAPAAEQDDIPF